MKNIIALSLTLFSLAALGVGAGKVWRVPTGETVPAWGPVNLASSSAVTGTLARSSLPAVGQQFSSTVSSSTSSASFSTISGLTVTLTSTGRPVFVGLQGDTSGSFNTVAVTGGSGISVVGGLQLVRDGSVISTYEVVAQNTSAAMYALGTNCSAFWVLDVPSAGAHTYTAKQGLFSGSGSFGVNNCKMVAFEL